MSGNLQKWGWSSHFELLFVPYASRHCLPGRVITSSREICEVITEKGAVTTRFSGKLRFQAEDRRGLPAVGDWVALGSLAENNAVITAILPRKSKFSRKTKGLVVEEQVIAANVDTVFLLTGLNKDFNLRRIERYLVLARESGACPVVVLNKKDLCDCVEARAAETAVVAAGVPVHAVSALTGEGLADLECYLVPGSTVALLGSSGAGKSTLLNSLAGSELQRVSEVRAADDRGRHTTSRSDIILLPGGALVIDTPGLRELQLWGGSDSLGETFEDIEALAARCRFNDCRHRQEPGCVVREALRSGELDPERFKSYTKLQRELTHLERSRDYRARKIEQAKWKAITKAQRSSKK